MSKCQRVGSGVGWIVFPVRGAPPDPGCMLLFVVFLTFRIQSVIGCQPDKAIFLHNSLSRLWSPAEQGKYLKNKEKV